MIILCVLCNLQMADQMVQAGINVYIYYIIYSYIYKSYNDQLPDYIIINRLSYCLI